MFAAQERGALIFEAFANSPPWFMTISGTPRYDWKAIQNAVTEQAKQRSLSERCLCLRMFNPIESHYVVCTVTFDVLLLHAELDTVS